MASVTTRLASWEKRENHWRSPGPFDCCCVGEETDSPLVRCREGLNYEHWLVELLAWIRENAEVIGDKPQLDYLVLSLRFDVSQRFYVSSRFDVSSRFECAWFVDRHKYWACDCDFKMQMRSNHRLTRTVIGWHKDEVFALPPPDRLKINVLMLDW